MCMGENDTTTLTRLHTFLKKEKKIRSQNYPDVWPRPEVTYRKSSTKPPGGLVYFKHISGGLNRDGGAYFRGGLV